MNTVTKSIDGIKAALQAGCRIRAFRSGGGLRVVRIEKDNELKGYGEHPHIEEALQHADEDYLAGGRPYKEVYGGKKTHYLTGSCDKSNELDGWILKGSKFESWQEGEIIFFALKGMIKTHAPEEIVKRVLENGIPIQWENRGYTYESYRSYLGRSLGVSAKVIKSPEGKRSGADPWMHHISKTGQGSDFWEACQNAFQAEEVETSDE